MASTKRKRRRARPPRKKGGVMMGMRSGFKKAAGAVTGAGANEPQRKKGSWVGTAITLVLVIAAVAFFFFGNR